MNPTITALVPKEYVPVLELTDITTALLLSKSDKSNVNLKQNWTKKKKHGRSDDNNEKIRWTTNISGPFDVRNAESMRNDFFVCLENYQVALGYKLCPVESVEIQRQDISHRTTVEDFDRRKLEDKKSRELKRKEWLRTFNAVF